MSSPKPSGLLIAGGSGGGFDGWMLDVHTIWKNEWCVVMIRDVPTEWGTVKHATIRTAMNAELGWAEKQRLKNEVFGADSVAIEVYPHGDRVVDATDVYHLWILPVGMELPFGLHERDRGSDGGYRPKAERRAWPHATILSRLDAGKSDDEATRHG